jgi:transcription-repair coupling factor (superfamily II helicase)
VSFGACDCSGGAVYFPHNRVSNIVEVADEIQQLVPDASILVGTGRWARASWKR